MTANEMLLRLQGLQFIAPEKMDQELVIRLTERVKDSRFTDGYRVRDTFASVSRVMGGSLSFSGRSDPRKLYTEIAAGDIIKIDE